MNGSDLVAWRFLSSVGNTYPLKQDALAKKAKDQAGLTKVFDTHNGRYRSFGPRYQG